MNKTTLRTVFTACIIITIASASSAIKANKQRKQAQAEIEDLNKRLTELNKRPSRQRSEQPKVAISDSSTDTNQLVTLKEASAEAAPEAEKERPQRQRESFEDRIAKMKEEDPEGYAEMVQKRQERQEEMRYNLAERTATFMDLDTSLMTEEERLNHEQLVEKMANVWALTEQFQDPEAAPDREAMRELFTAAREVRPLMEVERTIMFKQLGSELGYEGDESEAFATHVEDIINATSIQMPGRGGRGGGGGGR
jgi:hypothetical protein